MLIIVGQRKTQKHAGTIEDFCPICRALQSFDVSEQRTVTHLYFIPLHSKSTGHFTKTCSDCRVRFSEKRDPFDALDGALQRETGAQVARGAHQRAALEGLVSAEMEEALRGRMLREPFLALAPWVESHKKSGPMDALGVLSVILLITGMAGFVVALVLPNASLSPLSGPFWLGFASLALVIGAGVVFARTFKRFIRREVHPLLVRSLQPLQPSLEELEEVCRELRGMKLVIGKAIEAKELCAAIMEADERALHALQHARGTPPAPMHKR